MSWVWVNVAAKKNYRKNKNKINKQKKFVK